MPSFFPFEGFEMIEPPSPLSTTPCKSEDEAFLQGVGSFLLPVYNKSKKGGSTPFFESSSPPEQC